MQIRLVLFVAALACGVAFAPPLYAQDHTHSRAPTPAKKKSGTAADGPFGREGDPRRVKRVIKVEMSDAMRYFPDQIRVKRGDTVRFAIHNGGHMPHEMVIGTMDDLKQHAEMMRKEHTDTAHNEPYAAEVAPGENGRIVWQFTHPGEFYYACLLPGHFEAGMIGTIVVR